MIDKAIIKALEETGLPWEIEKGTKHGKLRLAGRMIGVIQLNTQRAAKRSSVKALVCTIRKKAKEILDTQ